MSGSYNYKSSYTVTIFRKYFLLETEAKNSAKIIYKSWAWDISVRINHTQPIEIGLKSKIDTFICSIYNI